MTEEEWLACQEPTPLLEFLKGKATRRKLLLLMVACYERLEQFFIADVARGAIACAYRYAEGQADDAELEQANHAVRKVITSAISATAFERCGSEARFSEQSPQAKLDLLREATEICPAGNALVVLVYATWSILGKGSGADGLRRATVAVELIKGPEAAQEERLAQAALLRDIFGNPFRPVAVDPSWRTDTAVSLARTMYEARDFSAIPILADALQDAGCDNSDILNHCRGTNTPHVRGCWVVDLLLGKC
jgi:hypothetical protein